MDKQHFEQLIKGVREMKYHIAGKVVRGARSTELIEPDIRAIREAAKISQTQFAKLIGVNVRTLQNWEQHRTRPGGASACATEDSGVESEGGNRGSARVEIWVPRNRRMLLPLTSPGFLRYRSEKGLKEGSLAVHPLWFQLWRPDEVAQFNEEYQVHKFAPGFVARKNRCAFRLTKYELYWASPLPLPAYCPRWLASIRRSDIQAR